MYGRVSLDKVFYIGSVSAFLSFMSNMPPNVRNSLAVIFVMIFVDTITGVTTAMVCKELRSLHFRQRLVVKLCQYLLIFLVGLIVTVVAKTYLTMELASTTIAASELMSIIESLVRMQRYGVKL